MHIAILLKCMWWPKYPLVQITWQTVSVHHMHYSICTLSQCLFQLDTLVQYTPEFRLSPLNFLSFQCHILSQVYIPSSHPLSFILYILLDLFKHFLLYLFLTDQKLIQSLSACLLTENRNKVLTRFKSFTSLCKQVRVDITFIRYVLWKVSFSKHLFLSGCEISFPTLPTIYCTAVSKTLWAQ